MLRKISSIFGLIIFSVLICSCSKDERRIEKLIQQQSETELNEYKVFKAPSYPEEISRIMPEWEQTQCLVLALPYNDVFSNEAMTDYFMEIIDNTIHYTDVLVLVDEEELGSLKELIVNLEERGLDKYVQNKDHPKIEIMTVRLDSKWIRDFGPIFALKKDGTLCLLDAIYEDVRDKPIKNEANLISALRDSLGIETTRNEDDVISVYIANYLYPSFEKLHKVLKPVRPPFQLQGGDFQTDGKGNIFCSNETLIMNGGSREDVELIFKYYYGMKDITYLYPLPGQTIKHIDMFFKVIDESTIVLGEYKTDTTAREEEENTSMLDEYETDTTAIEDYGYEYEYKTVYDKYLQDEAQRVLEQNYSLIKQKFPHKKIIRMPMAPIEIEVRPEYIALAKKLYYKNYLKTKGRLTPELDRADLESLQEAVVTEHRRELMSRGRKPADLASDYVIRLLLDFQVTYLELILKEEPDACLYIYRTYLNSTYINGERGKVLLVPSYEDCQTMEERVREIYERVYPNTDIVFINSDEIIKQYGTIHCVTSAIPKLK
jgi:agmatine/peptidylarginine deiminase